VVKLRRSRKACGPPTVPIVDQLTYRALLSALVGRERPLVAEVGYAPALACVKQRRGERDWPSEEFEPGGERGGERDRGLDGRPELADGRRGEVAPGAVASELAGGGGLDRDEHERVAPGCELGCGRDRAAAQLSLAPEVTAIVRTHVDPRRRAFKALNAEVESLGAPVAKTMIPLRSAFNDAGVVGLPVSLLAPDSEAAIAYRRLGQELASLRAVRKAA